MDEKRPALIQLSLCVAGRTLPYRIIIIRVCQKISNGAKTQRTDQWEHSVLTSLQKMDQLHCEATMKDVFVSYHYDEGGVNAKLVKQVEDLLESHNLRAVTGDVLAGGAVTPEIQRQIEDADALVALLTRRDSLKNGTWTTHPFCVAELQHARTIGKPAIGVVEEGVQVLGLFQEYEYIKFTSAEALPAFLKLSRTIWRWKLRAGRTLKIQLIPENVAQEIWASRASCSWEYRLASGIKDTDWQRAKPRKEPGGLFLYVQVPDDTVLIEVRIKSPIKLWSSDATPFQTPLILAEQA